MTQIEALKMAIEHLGFCAKHGDKRAAQAVITLENMAETISIKSAKRVAECNRIKNSVDACDDRRGK